MGRACKLPFSYGLETDPGIASIVLARLTMDARHPQSDEFVPKVNPPRNCIPLKAITGAFTEMPKKLAAHRDGWTWELLMDAAQTPSTA